MGGNNVNLEVTKNVDPIAVCAWLQKQVNPMINYSTQLCIFKKYVCNLEAWSSPTPGLQL